MKTCIALAAILCTTGTHAQVTIHTLNAGGGTYTQGNVTLEWNIGEAAVVETMRSADAMTQVTHGVLQPNMLSSRNSQSFGPEEIRILPNPTYHTVEINVLTTQRGQLKVSVVDALGKSITIRSVALQGSGAMLRVDLSAYAAGAYFFRLHLEPVAGSVRKTGSYTIIKQ